MRTSILQMVQCPRCGGGLEPTPLAKDDLEVRRGVLTCLKNSDHYFEIRDGVVRFTREQQAEGEGEGRLALRQRSSAEQDLLELMNRLAIGPRHRVLDVNSPGCWSSRVLAQNGSSVVALNSMGDGFERADVLFKAYGVYFERILAPLTLDFLKSGGFDHVILHRLEMESDCQRVFGELHRILRRGGAVAWFSGDGRDDSDMLRALSHSKVKSVCRGLGFHLERCVTQSAQEDLKARWGSGLAMWAARLLETFPSLSTQPGRLAMILRK